MIRRAILPIALLVLIYLALAGGRVWLEPEQVLAGLMNSDDFVIQVLRLPRLLVAIGAGLALGLAGALMQGLTRNILATPDVIGLTQGAGFGYAIAVLLGTAPMLGAVMGALVAMLVVVWLARGQGPLAFVLFGIGVGASAAAATTILMIQAPDAKASSIMIWLSGSLANADMTTALLIWSVLLACLAILLVFHHHLSLLWLGDDVMSALGVNLVVLHRLVLIMVSLLAAVSVLAIGPIGFLAFAAAPLARAVSGAEPPSLFPAALMGACLLVLGDFAARMAASLALIPTGLVISLIGATYLAFLLWREGRVFSK